MSEINKLDKESAIVKLVIRRLKNDIDISKENVNIGKTLYKDVEVDDNEETKYFVEMYCEISMDTINKYASYFEEHTHEFVLDMKSIIKDRIVWIIYKVFKSSKKLQGLEPDLEDLELDIGLEKDQFVIQINVTSNQGEANG